MTLKQQTARSKPGNQESRRTDAPPRLRSSRSWDALLWLLSAAVLASGPAARAEGHTVYGVFRPLDYGNPGELPEKDYFVSMGSAQGLRRGAILQVLRRAATYDLSAQKLHRDITFPLAELRVIHVEPGAAVARLEKLLDHKETPASATGGVLVGDLVRLRD